MNTSRVSVLIVDDHDLVREGLRALLGRQERIEIVDAVATGEEALALLARRPCDVIVLDYQLPGMNGLELCREIAEQRFRTEVVILSSSVDEQLVFASLWAGARAYVVKDVEGDELERAIFSAAAGKTSLDPKVTQRLIGLAARIPMPSEDLLSPRLRQILQSLAEGMSARDIERQLGLKRYTVKSYRRDIYLKLGVKSREEAVAVALRQGFL